MMMMMMMIIGNDNDKDKEIRTCNSHSIRCSRRATMSSINWYDTSGAYADANWILNINLNQSVLHHVPMYHEYDSVQARTICSRSHRRATMYQSLANFASKQNQSKKYQIIIKCSFCTWRASSSNRLARTASFIAAHQPSSVDYWILQTTNNDDDERIESSLVINLLEVSNAYSSMSIPIPVVIFEFKHFLKKHPNNTTKWSKIVYIRDDGDWLDRCIVRQRAHSPTRVSQQLQRTK